MTLSSLSNTTLPWQALRPELTVTDIPSQPQDFFALQPRAGEAVHSKFTPHFIGIESG